MCRTKAGNIVGLFPHSYFLKCFHLFLFFSFFPFFPEKLHKILCIPEPLCRQHWTPAANQALVLLKAGLDVARRFIGSSTSSCPVAKSCVGLGSATEPVMDCSPHFQPYSSAEAKQAGVKTDMETCGDIHLIFQRGFPFQLCSSHFGRDFPLLSWPASSVVLLNKSGFVLQSHKCCHLQQYLGTAGISR